MPHIDLGSGVAEQDTLLEQARVETSAFSDLINDRVDLIPGTKGSGKSALFRIMVDFLPNALLDLNRVVVAHGVQQYGDSVFHAYKDEFEKLSEDDFTSFWCIYLVSLAHEHLIKGEMYSTQLEDAEDEVKAFMLACSKSSIPNITAKKSLKDILAWTLAVLKDWRPKLKLALGEEGVSATVDLFGQVDDDLPREEIVEPVPRYMVDIKTTLENVLAKTGLSIWLMIDRLDEVFPRRSEIERRALRGLLRAVRPFASERIRIKIFLRDDMLHEMVSGPEGFTALTHLTARQADTLRWSESSIQTMIVKRLFANKPLVEYLGIDTERLEASQEYRNECFYKVFPSTVFSGEKQSSTLGWIYGHTKDGRGVVTPRDVIDLLRRAIQWQTDQCRAETDGESENMISGRAIRYGLDEVSIAKRTNLLKAEFPHLWPKIEKFEGGRTEYRVKTLRKMFGKNWEEICGDLTSIGLLQQRGRSNGGSETYWIPHLYRRGLDLTQGKA